MFGRSPDVPQEIGLPLQGQNFDASAFGLCQIDVIEACCGRDNDLEAAPRSDDFGIDPIPQANPEDFGLSYRG
jgi:hypothetical protein